MAGLILAVSGCWRAAVTPPVEAPAIEVPFTVPWGEAPPPPRAPAVVFLHGRGSEARSFVAEAEPVLGPAGYVVIGIQGTLPVDGGLFRWSEDLDADAAHVERALAHAGSQIGTELEPRLLLGFSQGGHLAAALIAKGELRFDGAIVMSPGWRSDDTALPTRRRVQARRAIVYVGAGDQPERIQLAREDARALQDVGVEVELTVDEELRVHGFPDDMAERVLVWLAQVAGRAPLGGTPASEAP
ncbi:MAG: alpha/beta fold hydrolase [Myxococcota bacterium]